jgi:hypothetical protein
LSQKILRKNLKNLENFEKILELFFCGMTGMHFVAFLRVFGAFTMSLA